MNANLAQQMSRHEPRWVPPQRRGGRGQAQTAAPPWPQHRLKQGLPGSTSLVHLRSVKGLQYCHVWKLSGRLASWAKQSHGQAGSYQASEPLGLGQARAHHLIKLQAWSGSATPPSHILRSRGMIFSKSSSSLTAQRQAHEPAQWSKPRPLKSRRYLTSPSLHLRYDRRLLHGQAAGSAHCVVRLSLQEPLL